MMKIEGTLDPEVNVIDGALVFDPCPGRRSNPHELSNNPAFNLHAYNERGPDCVVEVGRSTFKCVKLAGLKKVLIGMKRGEIEA